MDMQGVLLQPGLAALATMTGYLAGAISFTRIVSKIVAPQTRIEDLHVDLPGTDRQFHWTSISATTASISLGPRVGCTIALLDALKVAVPTLIFKLVVVDKPYFLIAATAGVVGHNWPIFHRFRGGRGISAALGGFIVVEPLGALLTSTVGMLVGMVIIQDFALAFLLGLWLFIPWLWWRTHDLTYVAYASAVSVLVVLAAVPDLKQYIRYRREGYINLHSILEATPMGRGMLKISQWFRSLPKKFSK